jgi:hypothetical protein
MDLGELGVLLAQVVRERLYRQEARIDRARREIPVRIRELALPQEQRPRRGIGGQQIEQRRRARAWQARQEQGPPDRALENLRMQPEGLLHPEPRREQLHEARAGALAAPLVEGVLLEGLAEHAESLAEVVDGQGRGSRGGRHRRSYPPESSCW